MTKKSNTPLEVIRREKIYNLWDSCGSCPCGKFLICGVSVKFHCWRTNHDNCDCKHSGIHISQHEDMNWNLQDIGEECFRQITEIWNNTDWEIVYDRK